MKFKDCAHDVNILRKGYRYLSLCQWKPISNIDSSKQAIGCTEDHCKGIKNRHERFLMFSHFPTTFSTYFKQYVIGY